MNRIDANRVEISTPQKAITLFANEEVFVDRSSVDEIVEFARVCDTIERLKKVGYLDPTADIESIILTPDFHKGAGIPIGTVFESRGFVIPRAVGSDIGCGMRFMTTDVTREEFDSLGDRLDQTLRYIFFEGGRNIPLSAEQRLWIFRAGLYGLLQTAHSDEGIWSYWDNDRQSHERMNVHEMGRIETKGVYRFDDFVKGAGLAYTRDDQIGSIGGGNHFCEFQVIEQTYDRHLAYQWNLKPGHVAIMVHSGSVGIGHQVGNYFTDIAREMYPEGLRHEHDHYMLATNGKHQTVAHEYLSAMGNAANFAFANRLFLGLMMIRALSETLGRRIETRLVHDAPHNLIWNTGPYVGRADGTLSGGECYLHRKGACPAEYDTPVIIPGSMGSDSFIMVGAGLKESYCSACHGAGRAKPRQQGRKTSGEFPCRVVTKIDPRRVRRDIQDDYMKSLMEEAPDRYKPITPIIETVEGAGMAQRVARTFPLLTVKGL